MPCDADPSLASPAGRLRHRLRRAQQSRCSSDVQLVRWNGREHVHRHIPDPTARPCERTDSTAPPEGGRMRPIRRRDHRNRRPQDTGTLPMRNRSGDRNRRFGDAVTIESWLTGGAGRRAALLYPTGPPVMTDSRQVVDRRSRDSGREGSRFSVHRPAVLRASREGRLPRVTPESCCAGVAQPRL